MLTKKLNLLYLACPSITSSTDHVCLQPQSYTFWRLQQVNQFNWEMPPPPPPPTGLHHRMSAILAK